MSNLPLIDLIQHNYPATSIATTELLRLSDLPSSLCCLGCCFLLAKVSLHVFQTANTIPIMQTNPVEITHGSAHGSCTAQGQALQSFHSLVWAKLLVENCSEAVWLTTTPQTTSTPQKLAKESHFQDYSIVSPKFMYILKSRIHFYWFKCLYLGKELKIWGWAYLLSIKLPLPFGG